MCRTTVPWQLRNPPDDIRRRTVGNCPASPEWTEGAGERLGASAAGLMARTQHLPGPTPPRRATGRLLAHRRRRRGFDDRRYLRIVDGHQWLAGTAPPFGARRAEDYALPMEATAAFRATGPALHVPDP